MRIDLNCDLGESFGAYRLGDDAGLMPYITSANIACGFHAGDPSVMRHAVRLCLEHGVAVGAHPGLPDLQGFGRRAMAISPEEAYDLVVYQVGALAGVARAEGAVLRHVKPHGALYNMAERDDALAEAIAEAVARFDDGLALVGLAGGALVRAGERRGLFAAHEVFADRTYQSDGTLTPRAHPQALVPGEEAAAAQVLRLLQEGRVRALDGADIARRADTVCVHGDTPGAARFARRLRETLAREEIACLPLDGRAG